MKIAVITARYSVSGVPLAQIRLADGWCRHGADVDLLFGNAGAAREQLDNGHHVIDFGVQRAVSMLPKLMRYFRTQRPDIVFSAEDHLNVIVLLAAILVRSRALICCSSRVTPFDTYGRGSLPKRVALKWLMKVVMWRATLLTCVSRDMVEQYRQLFGGCRHVAAYNMVGRVGVAAAIDSPSPHPWLDDAGARTVVAAGSLEPWKGFADLVRAMTAVKPSVRLLILGEGSQRAMLEELIDELGLTARVQLVGQVDNPYAYYSRANVFALSSRVEGMPNVLVEAMMCGCTPVAANCPTGPRELLEGQRYGFLVPVGDWSALGQAINQAVDNPAPRSWLDEVVAPFTEEAVMSRYMQLLGLETSPAVIGTSSNTDIGTRSAA